MADATPAVSQEAAPGQVAVPGSTPAAAPQGQPAAEPNYKNLYEHPDFQRTFQPRYQQALSERQQAQAVAAAAQQEVLRMREQLKQMEIAQAPDDWEQAQVKLRQAIQERDEARQYAASIYHQQQEYETRRQQQEAVAAQIEADLDMLAEQFETTKEKIRAKNPKDFKEAMKHAKELYAEARLALVEEKKVLEKRQAEDREADMPDLGGGAPVPAISALEKQYAAATNSLDKARLGRLMRAELKKKQK